MKSTIAIVSQLAKTYRSQYHSQLIQNYLLYQEIGHHVDWYYRHWSKANLKQVEDFADQYAIQKSATATYIFNKLENKRKTDDL